MKSLKKTRGSISLQMCTLFIGTTVVCGACARQRPIETADVLTARRDADVAKVQMVTKKLIVDLVEHVAAKQKDFADGKSKIPVTVDVLVVSGGGDWGAFGAGYLKGWNTLPAGPMSMPKFDVVSGVSTGALIAPFIFVGTTESIDQVVSFYRNPQPDMVKSRGLLFFLPANESFAEVPGLERELRDAITPQMVAAMAKEAQAGRVLAVNTTDLDMGQPRAFAVSEEAIRANKSGDYETLNRMLLASSGIPGAFPPREINGSLYCDGGVVGNVMYGARMKREDSFGVTWKRLHPDLPIPTTRYWVILNNQFNAVPQTVQPTWPAIIGRSVEVGIRAATIVGLRHLVSHAELTTLRGEGKCEVHLVAIPDSWRPPQEGIFIKETMENLADLGEKMGKDPASWMSEVP